MRMGSVWLAAAVLTIAACSGGGDDGADEEPAGGASTTAQPTDTDTSGDGTDPEPDETASTTTETAPATTTTLPPEPYPAGVVWRDPVDVVTPRTGLYQLPTIRDDLFFEHVGDELWVLGPAGNGPLVARSLDGGESWTEVVLPEDPAGQRLRIQHVITAPDGSYLAVGSRGSNCVVLDTGQVTTCEDVRPIVFSSPDAATWTTSAPAGWDPPGANNLTIDAVVATDDAVLAAGTLEGPEWGAVLYSSADGITWTIERQLSNAGNRLSSADLIWDGTTLTYLAHETTCGSPFRTPGGWALGASWELHGRIFTGTDIASLTLQEPGAHPLSPEPLAPPSPPPVCEGLIDDRPYAFYPYPRFEGQLVDGTTTVFEQYTSLEQLQLLEATEEAAADDETVDLAAVRAVSGDQRFAQLVDGAWQLTEITDVAITNVSTFGFEGDGAFGGSIPIGNTVNVARADGPLPDLVTITSAGQVRSEIGPVLRDVTDLTAVGDTLLVLGASPVDIFEGPNWETPARVVVWRSTAGEGPTEPTCDLVAGGTCRQFDLRTHPDYPDFSGLDLSGIDLAASNIGGANFDGTNLSGARLWLATTDDGDEPPTFVDANLSGAQLQEVRIADMSGADVTGASFRNGSIDVARDMDLSTAVLVNVTLRDFAGSNIAGANVDRARLTVDESFIDLRSVVYDRLNVRVEPTPGAVVEVDLSGLDLSNVSIRGPLQAGENEGVLVIVTSLTDAVLDGTSFSEVDLSRVDPTIDLTELRVDAESSICPDGLPPDGEGLSGTCVRGLEE